MSKVVWNGDEDECWDWQSAVSQGGYGQFRMGGRRTGKTRGAHRVSYELFVGPVPSGLQLDHLCRNRACVNPAHLEPVTQRENGRRGIAGEINGARSRAKTHCPHGHEYTDANTYIVPSTGYRKCLICKRAADIRAQRRYQLKVRND